MSKRHDLIKPVLPVFTRPAVLQISSGYLIQYAGDGLRYDSHSITQSAGFPGSSPPFRLVRRLHRPPRVLWVFGQGGRIDSKGS